MSLLERGSRARLMLGVAMLGAMSVAACGRRDVSTPLVANLATEPQDLPMLADGGDDRRFAVADARSEAAGVTEASSSVSGAVTFTKARLFEREFLYGFDLQYSSKADPDYELIPQAEALGHVPCFFRRIGADLQLVADQSRLFESDVNHPELLLATYKILSEDDDTLTVEFKSGGLVLNDVYNGGSDGAALPKQVWIRSLTFVPDGDYLLQETGLLLADGSVQTFMESVFPRANLVPEDYVPLVGDSATEPLADRYGFITGGNVYVDRTVPGGHPVREATSYAARFAPGATGTIDWYSTPNVPDEFLPVLKSGVEGWNRYFEAQQGRPVMRFLGRLPADVKLGDPRYNVINYDTVADAGAAYESQAVDPMSGIQSHSLVYMPFAWYNIGVSLWQMRTDVPQPSAARLTTLLSPKRPAAVFATGHEPIRCIRSADELSLPGSALAASVKSALQGDDAGALRDLDQFGKRLMISTLFHEVGHALGLDHNFKGSLAFNGSLPQGPDNPTSWSVMDYNYYQNEMDLFDTVGGTTGPALEYDRQIISQLYHGGADVLATDAVIPACNDAEADNVDGGSDPLCERYDADQNPSVGVTHSWTNLAQATGAAGTESATLAEILTGLKQPVSVRFASSTEIPSAEALTTEAEDLGNKVGELANYFISAGAQSVRVNLRNNGKALRVWAPGVEVDEAAFRSAYKGVLTQALALQGLPDVPAAALHALESALGEAALTNPAIGATDSDRVIAAAAAKAAFAKAVEGKVLTSVARLQQAIYAGLGYDIATPFALRLGTSAALSGFEDLAVSALSTGAVAGLQGGGLARRSASRLTAASALVTWAAEAPEAVDAVATQVKSIQKQGLAAGDVALVASTRELLKALGR